MKKIVEKIFLKKKRNFDTMMFDIVDVKNFNAEIFMKYYIDDITTISNNFMKFVFEFEDFLKKENAMQTYEKKQKKRIRKKREREFRRDERKKDK